jgi:hypothetical protein
VNNPTTPREMIASLRCENAALRQALEDMPTCRCGLSTDEQCALSVENAVLRKDSARLNWFINLDEEDRVKFCRGWYRWTPEQVRAEIDEELRKEAQP